MTTSWRLGLGLGTLTAVGASICAAVVFQLLALQRDIEALPPVEGQDQRAGAVLERTQTALGLALVVLAAGTLAGILVTVSVGRRLGAAEKARRASESLHQQTLQALPAHISVIDGTGHILAVNQAWQRFAAENGGEGLPGVATGVSYLDVCRAAAAQDDAGAKQALSGIEAVLDGSSPAFSMEYPCHAPDEQRWFLMSVVPLDLSGETGAVITHLDVSEQHRAGEALRKSRAQLRLFVEQAPVGMAILDRDMDYLAASNRWIEQYGRGHSNLVGLNHYGIHPDIPEAWREAHRRALTGVPTQSDGDLWIQADGSRHWQRWAVHPWHDESGQIGGIIIAAEDVTAQKLAEEALLHSREDLNRAQSVGHIGSWRLDVRHNVLAWSPECYRIFGIPEGTPLTYETFLAAVHPEDRSHVDRQWHAALQGHPYDIEHRLLVDGNTKWVRERAELELDGNGRVRGGFGTTQDITDRKQAEAALRETDERLRLALDAAFLISFEWDIRRNQVRRHLSSEPALTVTPAAAPSTYEAVREVVHPEDRDRFDSNVRRALHGPEGRYENEFRIVRPDGEVAWLYERGFVEQDGEGRPLRLIGLSQDISARKRIEEALREADRRKDEFLATLSHELRNPLAPISNALAILNRRDAPAPEARAALGIIERQMRHMIRLIDDLLDVSRITRGLLALRTERVALADVLEQAVETARPHIEEAGHRLEMELPVDPVYLEADPVRLSQVFTNLLNNASKYTDSGGHIRLSATCRGAEVVVTVTDSGRGIERERLPDLFDTPSRVDTATGRSTGGLGIGLSLARSLAEMHGGSIQAHSAGPGQGSSFTVRLPALREPVQPLPPEAAPPHEQASQTPRRILVADDNPDIVESMAMLLRLDGDEVFTARDGEEAVEIAERQRPDVVLLDIGMPRLDGHEVCRRIRARPWARHVTIVALTGWGQDDDRRNSAEAGFDAHLVKPVEPASLSRRLDEIRAAKQR